jgi:hypothetical protein
MPLTQFLKIPAVAKSILERYPFPSPVMESVEIRCPPKTKEYGVAGTAVDYVFRAIIEKKFSKVAQIKRKMWVAEEFVGGCEAMERRELLPFLDQGRKVFFDFLEDGKMTYAFIKGMCHLARIDTVYRSNAARTSVPWVNEALIEDVAEVAKNFNVNIFGGGTCYELNPTFDFASRVVGGADADLIISYPGNQVLLVDFKTTIEFKFTRDHWLQLVGYSILRSMLPNVPPITHTGIYFSRHGHLEVIPLSVGGKPDFPDFVDGLIAHAKAYKEDKKLGIEEKKPRPARKTVKKSPQRGKTRAKKVAQKA